MGLNEEEFVKNEINNFRKLFKLQAEKERSYN